jgi:hypothetical protein
MKILFATFIVLISLSGFAGESKTLTCDESVNNFDGNKFTLEINQDGEIEKFSFVSASKTFKIENGTLEKQGKEYGATVYLYAPANLTIKYQSSQNDTELIQYNYYTPTRNGNKFTSVYCTK